MIIHFPGNATVSSRGYLGAGAGSLPVKQYEFSVNNLDMYLTVTEDCFPVADTYYGKAGDCK